MERTLEQVADILVEHIAFYQNVNNKVLAVKRLRVLIEVVLDKIEELEG